MTDGEHLAEALPARPDAVADRRAFVARALSAAALGTLAARPAAAQTATPTPTPTATTTYVDGDYLNFALNIEYLTANFFSYATTGAALASADTSGSVGTLGAASGGRTVTFTDAILSQMVREMAADDLAHVRFLRNTIGSATLYAAQPAIDLSPGGAFTIAMRSAGVIGGSDTFDPYASEDNFLLAAFFLKDVAVAAYKAATPGFVSTLLLEAFAGMLGTEAYHAATIRAALYRRGLAAGSPLFQQTEQISARRDVLDGAPAENLVTGVAPDDDQGITPAVDGTANIVPANANGLVFSRGTDRTLNILYLTTSAASTGGFFPAGLNGTIKTAVATA